MSSIARRSLPPRPYGSRPRSVRPYYGVRPMTGGAGLGAGLAPSNIGAAVGAIGGTLGCLLCLAAIGALGLFSTVVALTAYTEQFVDKYKIVSGITDGADHMQIGFVLLFASLVYSVLCRFQRN